MEPDPEPEPMAGAAAVTVSEHATKGRVLLAARSFRAGQLILEEKPLLLVAADGSAATAPQPPALGAATDGSQWSFFCAFRAQPAAVQSTIVDGFFAPVDGEKARALRTLTAQAGGLQPDEVELFVKVSMIFEFNGADVSPPAGDGERPTAEAGDAPEGTALFETACMMSHSCCPNATWHTSATTSHRHVRALRSIACGEELTIDYLGNADTTPSSSRRAELMRTKGFACDCARCANLSDDTRRFPCCSGASCASGHHRAQQQDAGQLASLTPCCECGAEAPGAYVQEMLAAEAYLQAQLARILRTIECGGGPGETDTVADPVGAIEQLRAPHPHHYLAEQVAELQWELAQQQGRWEQGVLACRAKVACRSAIVGEWAPHRRSAFAFEYLGDALTGVAAGAQPAAGWFTNAEVVACREAEAALQRAVQMLTLTDGAAEPFTVCATKKLAAARKRLRPEAKDPEALAGMCEFCGMSVARTGAVLRRCGRCTRVGYCCPEHQKAAWPVHKKVCKPKTQQPTPAKASHATPTAAATADATSS